jgi:hypothetical protein
MNLRVCLVGKKRNGNRVIVWTGLLKLMFFCVILGTVLASVVYLGITRRWNPQAPLAGAAAGVATALLAFIVNLFTPRKRLPVVGG